MPTKESSDILYFVIVSDSNEKTKNINEMIIISIACSQSLIYSSVFLGATELLCYPKTIKNIAASGKDRGPSSLRKIIRFYIQLEYLLICQKLLTL